MRKNLVIILIVALFFGNFGIFLVKGAANYKSQPTEAYRQYLIRFLNFLIAYIKILQEKIAQLKLNENFSQNRILSPNLTFESGLFIGEKNEENKESGRGSFGGGGGGGSNGSGSGIENTYYYDVVVVGAGTGGVMAAIQAARLGVKVALIEETDWIGGQATAAGVASTDGGYYGGSGLFTEFKNKIINYYQSRGKSPKTCWAAPCYEPSVARQILNEMIAEARKFTSTSALDVFTLEKVNLVFKNGNKVTGLQTETGKKFMAKIIIDATEYGDVIPLTGARYRVGNSTSDNINHNSCVQDITYTAIIKKYPDGLPIGFYMDKPPGPQNGSSSYAVRREQFKQIVKKDGSEGFPIRYPVNFFFHNSYRGIPDSSNFQNYEINFSNPETFRLITKTSVNWANDYPEPIPYIFSDSFVMPVDYIENPSLRKQINCEAKLKTLQFVYYVQHELGEPLWSIANDEGYAGLYNNQSNSCPNIGPEYKILEKNMPVIPYVREARRIVGLYTLKSSDIKRTIPFSNFYIPAKKFPTSVAVGDYGFDQHNCKASSTLELDLDSIKDREEQRGHPGPFAVPFESFIPETIDGFIVAEKNLSASRMAESALRLHPITMNTGQAAGAIAALSVKENVEPRNLDPKKVQKVLLDAGMKISYYLYSDVPESNPFWKHIQFVSVHDIMTGNTNGTFGVNDTLKRSEAAVIIAKLANLDVSNPPETPTFEDVKTNDFAYPYIEALYKAGITSGCSLEPLRYCPDSQINRAQFAVFLAKALNFDTSNVSQEPHFVDVPPSSSYFKFVQYLYERGITKGCTTNPAKFCPTDPITKGQAAAFIASSLWNR